MPGYAAGGITMKDGQAELLSQIHSAARPCDSPRGSRRRNCAAHALAWCGPFRGDDHRRAAHEFAKPAEDRRVLAEFAVSRQFEKSVTRAATYSRKRGRSGARDLRFAPRIELGINLSAAFRFLLQARELRRPIVASCAASSCAQFRDLGFDLGEGFFEVEKVVGKVRGPGQRKAAERGK